MLANSFLSGTRLKGRRRADGDLPGISFEPCARSPRISICSYWFVWPAITRLGVTARKRFRSWRKCYAAGLSVRMSLNS